MKRLFKNFPSCPSTTNLLYKVISKLNDLIPSIQSHSLEEDVSGCVELLEFINPFNTKEMLKIKISADLIYNLNFVGLITRFPEDIIKGDKNSWLFVGDIKISGKIYPNEIHYVLRRFKSSL